MGLWLRSEEDERECERLPILAAGMRFGEVGRWLGRGEGTVAPTEWAGVGGMNDIDGARIVIAAEGREGVKDGTYSDTDSVLSPDGPACQIVMIDSGYQLWIYSEYKETYLE